MTDEQIEKIVRPLWLIYFGLWLVAMAVVISK